MAGCSAQGQDAASNEADGGNSPGLASDDAPAGDSPDVFDAPDADGGPAAVSETGVSLAAPGLPDAGALGPVLVSETTPGPGESHTSPAMVAGGAGAFLVAFDDTDEDILIHAVGWARSTSYGESFTDEGHFPDPPTGAPTDTYGRPCVGRDSVLGRVYVASLGSTPQSSNALAFYVSPDDGVTFNPALNAADPNLLPADFIDYPSLAVDNVAGYAQGTVYLAYADFVDEGTLAVKLRLSTFLDGTFAVTEVVSPALGSGDEASLPSVAVALSHDVLIAYYAQVSGVPSIAIVASTDQGNHFGTPIQVAPLHVPVPSGSFDGNLGLLGTAPDGGASPFDAFSSPQLAVNPASGDLYVVYVDATEDDKANVYFTQSQDEGQTWSAPVQVNDDATTNDQFLPAIAVSLDGTALAIDFYDRRDDAANVETNRYGVTAAVSDAGVHFTPNVRLTPSPFLVLVGGDPYLAPTYFASRTSMATDATSFYDAYVDTTDGHLDVRLLRYGIDR